MPHAADAPFATLRSLDMFSAFEGPLLEALSSAMVLRRLTAGEVLVRQGDEGDAMFVVRSGSISVHVREGDAQREVSRLGPGACVGEIQLLTASPRTATLIAEEAGEVLVLRRHALDALGEQARPFTDRLAQAAHRHLQANELANAIRAFIGPADGAVIEAFQRVARWVHVPRGEVLFKQGDAADAWFVVVSGRLEIEIAHANGETQVVGEVGAGESLGEIGLLTGEPRTATPVATRDVRAARIDREAFDDIMLRYPAVLMSVSRTLSRTLVRRTVAAPRRRPRKLSLCVLGATPGAPRAWVTSELAAELSRAGRVLQLSSRHLGQLGVLDAAARADAAHPSWRRLAHWLEQAEREHDFLLFEADDDASPWTRHALHHADHVLTVADSALGPAPSALEQALFEPGVERLRGARASLVLVHPASVTIPSGTSAWLRARPWLHQHHHVRAGRGTDVARVARLLSGRGVGLVLGGGGARGFAHLGVIRAMQELELPIDSIGGTSMGAVMAGQHAMGLGLEEAFELNARVTASQPFREFTLPFFSVLRSRRIDRAARMSFGEVQIEDLWTPYFCISANLTRAEMITHERGSLWRATRASGSLPGIALPVLEGESLLVDGGVINNLPGDIMRERCGGAVIAVDVSPEEDVTIDRAGFPSPWTVLWNRLVPFWKRPVAAPSISDIIMRTLMLGSANRTYQVRREVDLCLRPELRHFKMLEFGSMRQIAEAGYATAREQLPAWAEGWRSGRFAGGAPT